MSSRRPQLHLILLLLAYYCSTHVVANGGTSIGVQCLPHQASSLLQLKRSFLNPNLSSWQQGSDCCHWEGVGCDRDSGQVITLDLSNRNLQSISDLSPTLFNLTSLRNLSLAGNDFGMTTPQSRFVQHTFFCCNLSGEIPTWIGNLTKLSFLDLLDNRLSGKIPNVLFNLVSLEELNLSSNELYGTLEDIPDRLSTFLKHIDLSNNNLAGKIPKVLFTLPSLE
ncbi:hypothetical protein ZWY2020_032353 [Hordeum vulgare]|nr:hypothetical protein ZWY2020_032353 [Hordeum vulgare]